MFFLVRSNIKNIKLNPVKRVHSFEPCTSNQATKAQAQLHSKYREAAAKHRNKSFFFFPSKYFDIQRKQETKLYVYIHLFPVIIFIELKGHLNHQPANKFPFHGVSMEMHAMKQEKRPVYPSTSLS